MKILFYVLRSNPYFFSPPLGLSYIASYLLKSGYQVKIVDDITHADLRLESIKKDILGFAPDLVGVTTYTFTIKEAFLLAQWIKEIRPHIKIVFGGPHATYLPSETLGNKAVDIVVTGEGEETLLELVRSIEHNSTLKNIKGILYKDNNLAIIDNGPRPLISELDSMPFPAYELLDMSKYYDSIVFQGSPHKRFSSMLTSRGCPYECTFCSHKMFGKKVRMRSPANVVDEIELLAKNYGVGNIFFMDDAFLTDPQRIITICDLIIERKLDVFWGCNCRADHASAELFSAMRKAGCRAVFIGAESGSQELLNSMKKRITCEQIASAVQLAKKHIGHVVCGFIFGMPGDSQEQVEKTIRFARKLNPDYATFNIAIPLPGSEIFDAAVANGQINTATVQWEYFNLFPPRYPVLELSEINQKKLFALTKKAFFDFYFHPAFILGRLSKIRSIKDCYQYLQGFFSMITILNDRK